MFAGIRHFELLDERAATRFALVVMYPTAQEPASVKLAQFTEQLSLDAPAAGGKHALVIISHGSGGSHLTHRKLAATLARAGFIVAMPEHPGNNRNDNRLADALENMENRPRHLSMAIDAVLADSELAPHVQRGGVAIIGHSIGAYTALAVAGGVPRFPYNSNQIVSVNADARVKALVLMAPAVPWFIAEGALANVTARILMLTAELDPYTPPVDGQIVARGLPAATPLTQRCVPNAGHFSFLSPFPRELRRPGFLPAFDPDGFDREAFQQELGEELVRFLTDALSG